MFGDPVRNEKGWEIKFFDKIGKFNSGGTPSKSREDYWNGDYPWVSPKDMKQDWILDSQDHISNIVFEETNLRKIQPDTILIVVRGMILAHTFPVAINTIPISINQDMKAISLYKDHIPIFILYCIKLLSRKLLKAISSAAHGTKRFDKDAMKKIDVLVPPLPLQNKFADIVKKVESIKLKHEESLKELENLYGSLSQRAFRGEVEFGDK